jgi:hypothetical protein
MLDALGLDVPVVFAETPAVVAVIRTGGGDVALS